MEFNIWSPFKYIQAITTTRDGGISKGVYGKFNLAYQVGEDHETVTANRVALLKQLRLEPNRMILTHQSHSDIIKRVGVQQGGAGFTSFESGIEADALYTYDTRLALGIFHADCVPVFLFDKTKKWVAIIHAGMAGSLKRITEKSLQHLIKVEGSNPSDIYAYLGPSLTFAFNPIEAATMTAILALNPDFYYAIKKSDDIFYLECPLLHYEKHRKAGVPAINITNSGSDTFSQPDKYYSAARDKITGRHLSIIIRNR